MYAAQLRCVMPGGQVYSYNPLTDSLKHEGSAASISRPECVRVFVIGSTLQLQKKYRKIPYRLLLLEAGVILQQLSLVAAARSYKGFINGMLEPNAESNLFLRDSEKLIAEYRLGQ
jgi:hypothetical protein